MKKSILLCVLGAVVLSLGIVLAVLKGGIPFELEANVEALSRSESDPVSLCSTHCKFSSGYVCVLQTNHGYDINCQNMVPWFY